MLIAKTQTKKELKTKVGVSVYAVLTETSLFGEEIQPNATVYATSHPKRSWFAEVQLVRNR